MSIVDFYFVIYILIKQLYFMSSSRYRYTSRRDKNKKVAKNARMFLICILLFLVVYVIMNRVRIYDHFVTSFY